MSASEGQISVEIVGVDKFSQPMGQAGQAATKLGQSATSAQGGVTKLDTSLGSAGKNAGSAAGGLDKASKSAEKLGQTATTAEKSSKNWGLALAGVGTSIVGLATQITSLGNTYDNLNDAQLNIERGATRIKALNKGVEVASIALQKAQENEKTTAEELAVKEDAVKIAKERLNNAMNSQQNLIEDTGRAWQQFGLQIAGTVLQSIGSVTTAFAALGPAGKTASQGFGTAGTGAKGLLTSLGPIAIAVAAASAAFLAIKNNTFGFRDALSELGLKLGTAIPALKPLLDFLEQIGGVLGIAGDKSTVLKNQFIQQLNEVKAVAMQVFTAITDGVKWFIDQFMQAFDMFGKGDWAGGFNKIKEAFLGIINNETLQTFVKNIVDWVTNPTNWTDLGKGIIDTFNALFKFTANDFAPMLLSFVQSIVDWVTNVSNWQTLWDGLVQAWTDMTDWVSFIGDWMQTFIEAIVDWIGDGDSWQDVWDAIVEAWTDFEQYWTDIIDPWLKEMIKVITDWVSNPTNWSDLGVQIMDAIKGAVKWTNDVVAPIITEFFSTLNSMLWTPAEAFNKGGDFIDWIVNGFKVAIGKAGEVLGQVWQWIIDAIFGGGGGGGAWTGGKLIPNEASVTGNIEAMVAEIATFFENAINSSAALFQGMGQKIAYYVIEGASATGQYFGELITTFWSYISDAVAKADWKKIGTDIATAIIGAVTFIETQRNDLMAKFWTWIGGYIPAPEDAYDTGYNIANAIMDAIGVALANLADVAAGIFQAIIDAIFKPEGQVVNEAPVANATQLMLEAIKNAVIALGAFIAGIGVAIWERIATSVQTFDWSGAANTLMTNLSKAIYALGQYLVDLAKGFVTWIQQGITQTDWKAVGEATMKAIVDAIYAVGSWLSDLAKGFGTWISQGVAEIGPDLIKVGEGIVGSIVEGIKKVGSDIWNAITGFISNPFGGGQPKPEVQAPEIKQEPLPKGKTSTGKEEWLTPPTAGMDQGKIQQVALLGQGATQALTPLQDLVLQLGALGQALNLVAQAATNFITQLNLINTALQASSTVFQAWAGGINTVLGPLSQLIVAFCQQSVVPNITLISTALQANSTVWVAYGEGINTAIQAIAELIVTFCQESVSANLTLISTALQANMQVWIAWGTGLNTAIQPLAQLWVTFVNETIIANLTTMQEALTINQEAWTTWATQVGEIITLIGEALAQFLEDVFNAWQEGIIASLEEQIKSWEEYAQGVNDSLTDAGNSLLDFAEAVVELRDGVIDSCTKMSEAFQTFAEDLTQALEDAISALEDFISSLEDTVSALEDVTQAAEDTAEAIENIPDEKTIKIKYDVEKPPSIRYGGAFMTKGKGSVGKHSIGMQGGGSFVTTKPMNFRGANIGEQGKWELVTVMPLSNPAVASDKNSLVTAPIRTQNNKITGNLPANPVYTPNRGNITVQGVLNATLIMPDGRTIANIANPFLMEGQDAEL